MIECPTLVAHMERDRVCAILFFWALLLNSYCYPFCTSNLSLPLTLTVSNMSLYHFIPFFADVGLNIIIKFHKDVISTGIGEEPNRSDKPLMLPLLFFLILLLYTLFSQNFIIYLFFILIFFNIILLKIPLN